MKKEEITEKRIFSYLIKYPYSRVDEMCEWLNISVSTFYMTLKRKNIDIASIRDEARKQALENYIKKHPEATIKDITKHFKTFESLILKDLKKYGIKLNIEYVSEMKKQEEKRQLLEYIEKHPTESQEKIAKHFGISRQGLIYRMKKLNIIWDGTKVTRDRAIKKEELEDYIQRNPEVSVEDITKYFNISETTFYRIIKEYEIAANYKRKSKNTKIGEEELREYIAENPNKTQAEIAKHFNVTNATLNKTIKRYGIKWINKKRGKSTNTKISEEELREFISLHPEANQKKIGQAFNASQRTIGRLIVLYNIPWKMVTSKRKAKISKKEIEQYLLQNPNASGIELARHFGVSKSSMNRYIHNYEITIQVSNKRKIKKEELIQYVNEHPLHGLKKIARHFNVSKTTIERHIKNYGIVRRTKNNKLGSSITKEDLITYIINNPKDSFRKIAKYFNVSDSTIRRYIKLYEINREELRCLLGKKSNKKTKISFTKEEIIQRVKQMLKTIPNLTPEKLTEFLKTKNIDISIEEILKDNENEQEER